MPPTCEDSALQWDTVIVHIFVPSLRSLDGILGEPPHLHTAFESCSECLVVLSPSSTTAVLAGNLKRIVAPILSVRYRSCSDHVCPNARSLTMFMCGTPERLLGLDTIGQDEKAAEAAAAMDVDEDTPSNAAAQPKAGEEKSGGKLHVLGIGGRRAKRGSSKATGTKKTPGEIRIQKGD